MAENFAAAIFYIALASTVGGAIVLARGAVERRTSGNRLGIILVVVGIACIGASLAAYMHGPRRMLPF
ncbi:MAG: hypothetical protein IAI48_06135 [Candidatus Eremiobacteraeota bacterium]|nr:hypothetical protein [Candidatus Eremiobacteraeota bacterium]